MTSVTNETHSSDILLIETSDRKTGVSRLFNKADLASFSGKSVALKANFNSADPFPASTHIDTLKTTRARFEMDQIQRAAELGVGATSASAIKLTALDGKSKKTAHKIESILFNKD